MFIPAILPFNVPLYYNTCERKSIANISNEQTNNNKYLIAILHKYYLQHINRSISHIFYVNTLQANRLYLYPTKIFVKINRNIYSTALVSSYSQTISSSIHTYTYVSWITYTYILGLSKERGRDKARERENIVQRAIRPSPRAFQEYMPFQTEFFFLWNLISVTVTDSMRLLCTFRSLLIPLRHIDAPDSKS